MDANKWELKSLDVKTAFLQGKRMDRIVYIKPPKEADTNKIWLLHKCVYGLSDASRRWYLRVKEEIVNLGGEVNQLDLGLFLFHQNGKLTGLITCFVDDMIYGGNKEFEEIITGSLKTVFDIGTENQKAFSYVGINICQREDRSIMIDQHSYISSIRPLNISRSRSPETQLSKEETSQFKGLVGQLNWVCGITCPEISFEVCWASTRMCTPTVRDVTRLNKVVSQLKTKDNSILFPCLDPNSTEITVFTDASFNNLPNGGSQGGHVVFINDITGKSCPIAWSSGKIKRVVRSTLAAETLALADGFSTASYTQTLLSEIFPSINKTPIQARSDNKSLYDNVKTSHRVSDKGLVVDINYIREHIERGKLNLVWEEGSKQLSDVLTKRSAPSEALRCAFYEGKIPYIRNEMSIGQ